MRLMASDYDGFNDTDLARHITNALTQRTGRVWNATANERLATWLSDSVNRCTAVQWLVYVGEMEKPPVDPMEEFAFRMPMEEVLTGGRAAEPAGFEARERRWWLRRR